MVSIPSGEMSKLLHRLRVSLLRALFCVGVAQLAASGDGSGKVLGDLLRTLAPAPASTGDPGEGALDPVSQLQHGDTCLEVDEVDAGRRRLNVRSALPNPALPKVFWEESIRIRVEDRRNCRPPNPAV